MMTERDYINATNLAKARAASVITYSLLATKDDDKRDLACALNALQRIIDRLNAIVKTKG